MHKTLLSSLALACVIACGGIDSKNAQSNSHQKIGAAQLQWFLSCGDPVCFGYHPHEGVRLCTTEQAGDPCDVQDDRCDPVDECGALLVCTDSDPRQQPYGCPISREKFKQDIQYLGNEDLERYHDELISLPLATYRYRDAGLNGRKHLGFMIDGREELICVEAERDMIDLYGYTSMAVAALKVQSRQIEELQAKVDTLQRRLGQKGARNRPVH